jgi:pyridinium-3,5-biscarboxylic acid mononucleotide sulfurtransferase
MIMIQLSSELERKKDDLLNRLEGYGRVAVAFSAGIDSTVVAKAAQLACGEKAVAVTSISPSLALDEREQAGDLAKQIGIRHRFVETQEFQNERYLRNASDRCYFCKTELYTEMHALLPELEADVIVNGGNVDDRGDHRPGMDAAKDQRVRSPLIEAGLNKEEVRTLAKYWDLPVWDKPAMPCLASRVAYGVEVTPERVERVDRAESFLRREFGLRELRVRHEANDVARIEVPSREIPRFAEPENSGKISDYLHSIGFKFVALDLDGFRSGSLNAVLPVESLRVANKSK